MVLRKKLDLCIIITHNIVGFVDDKQAESNFAYATRCSFVFAQCCALFIESMFALSELFYCQWGFHVKYAIDRGKRATCTVPSDVKGMEGKVLLWRKLKIYEAENFSQTTQRDYFIKMEAAIWHRDV